MLEKKPTKTNGKKGPKNILFLWIKSVRVNEIKSYKEQSMIKQKLYVILALAFLAGTTHAADYALYSPQPDKGGEVSPDGTWEMTDECAASQSFQEQA